MGIKKVYIIIVVFFGFNFLLSASEPNNENKKKSFYMIIWEDLKCTYHDASYLGNEIIGMDLKDVGIGAGIFAGSALLMPIDDDIRKELILNKKLQPNKFLEITDRFGDRLTMELISGGVYLSGLISGDEYIRTTGRLLLEGLFVSGSVALGLRMLLGRGRPHVTNDPFEFKFFQTDYFYHSFPSGHATVAFTIASVLSRRIDELWAYLGLYGLACVSSAAMLSYDSHWFSDLFCGAAIGIISGKLVVNADKNRISKTKSNSDTKFSIYPALNGIRIKYRF